MAVVQLRNGIYVNSIETVPDADQTAAYKYASLFTKHRKENWTMSQKQAASEITDAKERDAASLKIYGQQLKDYNDRLLQLDKDIADAGTDVTRANAATERSALQEATARQKNAILWEQSRAKRIPVAGGGRSSSKSESSGSSTTSGGGGSPDAKAATAAASDADPVIATSFAASTTNDVATALNDLEASPEFAQQLPGKSDAERNAKYAVAVERLIAPRKAAYINQGYDDKQSYQMAEADVKNEADAAGLKQYGIGHDAFVASQAAGGGGGGSSERSSSSSSGSVRDPATLEFQYDYGDTVMPVATEITPKYQKADTTKLDATRIELAGQLAQLIKDGAPASTVDDFITRSREIMAGRFGSQQVSPNYYQRNAAQSFSGMSDADARALYDKYKAGGGGGAAGGGTLTPADPLKGLVYDTSYGESGGGPGPEPLGSLKTSRPGTPGSLVYDTSYGDTGGFGEAEPLDSLQTSVRNTAPPSSSDGGVDTRLMSGPTSTGYTVTEGGSGGGPGPQPLPSLQTYGPRQPLRQTELDALFPDGVPQEVLDAAANMQRSNPPPVSRPQMQNPGGSTGTVGPFMPGFGDPTPDIGSKPEAVGDFNIPDVPSVYNDRPFDPDTNPYGGSFRPNKQVPLPPAGDQSYSYDTWELGAEVPMSDSERADLIRRSQKIREDAKRKQKEIDDAADAKKKPKGKTGYFQQRFDNAKEIVSQPGKLARLIASGPGKVAADVYNANKANGKDFKLTYDTLTATYEDDKEALATAHQVALALDIANTNRTAPPKA